MASINKRTVRWTTGDDEQRTAVRYEAAYHDRNGKRHRRMFDLKRDAQRWLDEQAAGLVTGQWADPRAGKETFQAYAERWRTRQCTRRTRRTRSNASCGCTSTRTSAACVWTRWPRRTSRHSSGDGPRPRRRRPWPPGTRSWRPCSAEQCATGSCLRPRVSTSGSPRIKPKSALVPISTETVLDLREALPPRYRTFVILGAGTGMRRGELLGLTLDRVSVDFGTIRVDRQLARSSTSDRVEFSAPKTQASVRTIGVADFVLDAVAAHVATYGTHSSGVIFTSEVGSPVATSVLHRAWSIAARKVHTEATPHDLRHYFASVQIAGGCSIKKLQHMLGHKSATETWDTYGHLMGDEDDLSKAVIHAALGAPLQAQLEKSLPQ